MDDHDAIKQIKSYYEGNPDSVSLDDITAAFATLGDYQRTQTIQQLDARLDEPTSARKTAQLSELSRKFRAMHKSLRSIKR